MTIPIITGNDELGFCVTSFCGPGHQIMFQIIDGKNNDVQLTEWQVRQLIRRLHEDSQLAKDHKELTGKLREYCEFRHLGLGGEQLVDLALDHGRKLEQECIVDTQEARCQAQRTVTGMRVLEWIP